MTTNQLQLIISEAIELVGEMIYENICSASDNKTLREVVLDHFRENGINIDLINHFRDIDKIVYEGVMLVIFVWL